MNKTLFSILCSFLFVSQLQAEITSAHCPYSCRTQGIQKKVCKDWREGDRCFIDDLRHRPGQLSRQEEERRAEEKRREEKRRREERYRRERDQYYRHEPPRHNYRDDRQPDWR